MSSPVEQPVGNRYFEPVPDDYEQVLAAIVKAYPPPAIKGAK